MFPSAAQAPAHVSPRLSGTTKDRPKVTGPLSSARATRAKKPSRQAGPRLARECIADDSRGDTKSKRGRGQTLKAVGLDAAPPGGCKPIQMVLNEGQLQRELASLVGWAEKERRSQPHGRSSPT